ncbi:MAG TPA: SpoIIE family protein phosphatase [Candidatus Dormibacteraeota bacterium]|nr:SpoIIE family protein phosphatase [Candidatus Dormibacteraeota bacterium]
MKNVPLARVTGTLLMTAFLVVTLAFAVQGTFETRAELASTFSHEAQIQQAQIELEELLRLQIDEENSLRGYSLTRDPFYVAQYRQAAAGFDATESSIRKTLDEQQLPGARELIANYARLQSAWRNDVAAPLLRNPRNRLVELDKRNKLFSDYETRTVAAIREALAATGAALVRSTQMQLDRSSYLRGFWVLVFGILAILFNAYGSRLNRELEQERTITEILQRAFRSESVPLPHCEIGSAYLSATSHVAVGGDVFDVYRLSNTQALVLIADISGKGVDAAVLTAFIKFMIRAIALRHSDPAAILAEFNLAFSRAVGNPYLFVSMFVGVLDTDTLQLKYGSAGHDCAYLRGRDGVRQLSVTGPVLGVMEEPFSTEWVGLCPGDVLVLTTDGLTEVRNRAGKQLLGRGAMELIARAGPHAQQIADELVAHVKSRGGNRLRDDLAILAIRIVDAEPARG